MGSESEVLKVGEKWRCSLSLVRLKLPYWTMNFLRPLGVYHSINFYLLPIEC